VRDLKDYSGPFIPDLKRSDFSKEALVRAWEATSRCFVMIDGLWYTLIKEKYDEATAGKLDPRDLGEDDLERDSGDPGGAEYPRE